MYLQCPLLLRQCPLLFHQCPLLFVLYILLHFHQRHLRLSICDLPSHHILYQFLQIHISDIQELIFIQMSLAFIQTFCKIECNDFIAARCCRNFCNHTVQRIEELLLFLLKRLGYFHQQLPNPQMLWTHFLALATLNAIRRLSCVLCMNAIVPRTIPVIMNGLRIEV